MTTQYGGLKFYDIDGPLNGFSSAVNGFTLEDNCFVLCKLNEDASEKPIKEYGYKYCCCFVLGGMTSMHHITGSLRNTGVFKSYRGCDFYCMTEDYYKQHQEEAKEMGFEDVLG